jgi:hypothetical protein
MSNQKSKIKKIIQEYLIDEGLLRQRIADKDGKIEFGFQFHYPPGPSGHAMVVFKPINKDLIILSLGTQIAPPHIKALNSLDGNKKNEYFMELRKLFLMRDLFYRIDIENHRYEIIDQIFLNQDGIIMKKEFYQSIRKVFNSAVLSNILLAEYCAGKISPEDFMKAKEFNSNSDFRLYS